MRASRVAAKLREWVGRYLPGELVATAGALAGAVLCLGSGAGWAALVSTWSGTLAFYVFVTARELRGAPLAAAVRSVVAEFGVAEVCDTLCLRPLAIYACTAAAGSVLVGVTTGRLLADVAFYGLAIP